MQETFLFERKSDQRQLPKFDPQAFELQPIDRNADENIAQPSQTSPDSFRLSDINQGNIRPVSANLQDDGRNSAIGTQPIGNTAQTQTVQQQGGFQPRTQQPTVNQNLGQLNPNANSGQAGGQTPFTVTDPAPARAPGPHEPPVRRRPQPGRIRCSADRFSHAWLGWDATLGATAGIDASASSHHDDGI